MTVPTLKHKTAPAAGTAEADDPSKGTEMNTTIVSTTDKNVEQSTPETDLKSELIARLLPVALAHKPSWAEEPTAEDLDVDRHASQVAVHYATENFLPDTCAWDARLTVESYVVFDADGTIVTADQPNLWVYVGEQCFADAPPMTSVEARQIAAGLQRLADEFERIAGE